MIHKLIMAGLPGTGKTTFAAALWHVVDSKEVSTSMQLVRMHDETEYLSLIRNAWLSYQKLERTRIENEGDISLELVDSDGSFVHLLFTDMDGERFKSQWEDRQWDNSYKELVKNVSGVLLFIHPKKIWTSPTIKEYLEIFSLLEDLSEEIGSDENQGAAGEAENNQVDISSVDLTTASVWKPEMANTQVKVIDILQFILEERREDEVINLCVIISAWDWVEQRASEQSPLQFLEQTMPMLCQFLSSNNDRIRSQILGVSAQGGELNEADVERMGSYPQAVDRIMVVSQHGKSTDITEPIRWAMGLSATR